MSRTRATRNRRSRERFSSSSSRALNSELFLPRENPKRKRLRPSARQRERERERKRKRTYHECSVCDLCKTERKTEARDTSVFSFFRDEQKTKRPHNKKQSLNAHQTRKETKLARNDERTNERTGTVQKRSLLLSRRVRIIFGVVVLLCARSSFSICTSTREERTGAFISNLIRVL